MSTLAINNFRADGTYLYAEITWDPQGSPLRPVSKNIEIPTGYVGIGVEADDYEPTVQVNYIVVGIYPGDYPIKDVFAVATRLTGPFPAQLAGAEWPSVNVANASYVINPLRNNPNGFSVTLGTVPPSGVTVSVPPN